MTNSVFIRMPTVRQFEKKLLRHFETNIFKTYCFVFSFLSIIFIQNSLLCVFFIFRTVCNSNSSALYFGILAIVETLYLILHVIYELQMAWGYNTYNKRVSCELFNFFFITPQYMVNTNIVALF